MGVLDIKAKINNNSLVDLEMQRQKQTFYTKRVLLYASGLFKEQLKVGEDYQDLKDVIMINILDFNKFNGIPKVHTIWRLREDDYLNYDALEGLEVHFIELEKFRDINPNLHEKINQWLALIDTENKKWLEDAMKENKKVKDAKKKVDEFTADDEARELIELHEKWELDYNSAMRNATESGIAKGREEGREEGHKEGLAEGKIAIAKNMLSMNMSIKQIALATKLTEDEILKLIEK